jgi:hypothetical protein
MEKEFEVALSFAGEDRKYVDEVAILLQKEGIKVFYDLFEQANLWGKNLYDYLSEVYHIKAKFTIMFISEHYAKKLWTNHERQSMQARAFQENTEYILPARFDNTTIPGVLSTTGYIPLDKLSPAEFVDVIKKKLILSGSTIPSKALRVSSDSITLLPNRQPQHLEIGVVNLEGLPVENANIVLSSDNGTYLSATTNQKGVATFQIKTRRLYSLMVAHEYYHSHLQNKFDSEKDARIILEHSPRSGSIIIQSTGYIDGFKGRLNPIYGNSKTMYLYADNISINNQESQPVTFEIDKPLILEDCDGSFLTILFRFVNGHTTALIDYVKTTEA